MVQPSLASLDTGFLTKFVGAQEGWDMTAAELTARHKTAKQHHYQQQQFVRPGLAVDASASCPTASLSQLSQANGSAASQADSNFPESAADVNCSAASAASGSVDTCSSKLYNRPRVWQQCWQHQPSRSGLSKSAACAAAG